MVFLSGFFLSRFFEVVEMGRVKKIRMVKGRMDENWVVIGQAEVMESVSGVFIVVKWNVAVPKRLEGKVLSVGEDEWFGVKVAAEEEAPKKANYSLGHNAERFARCKDFVLLEQNRPALAEKVAKIVEKWAEGIEWVVDL